MLTLIWPVLVFLTDIVPMWISLLGLAVIFCYTEADPQRGHARFPARLFVLPVRTAWLVTWPMIYGVAAVLVVSLAWEKLVLASLPPGPANYVQRVGRAGRKTGNAFLLTLVGRRPRDLYFLDQPLSMIDGKIIPPGSYLSAAEILHRQYFAHLVDLAARGCLPGVLPVPRRASALFGDTGWLSTFISAALVTKAVEPFLDLFGDNVTADAADDLRAFAASGIADAVRAAEAEWHERLADFDDRLRLIEDALAALQDDADNTAVKRALTGHNDRPMPLPC